MNKNNLVAQNLLSKTNLALICALGMIAGFLVSRSLLSVSVLLFGAVALWNVHPRRWFTDKWWLLGVLWIAIYALSWFWTDDKHNWSFRFDVKLPILLLPLAFSFLPSFSAKQLRVFLIGAMLLFLYSAAWSMSFYFSDPVYYAEQYVYSHTLPTLAYNEHIRYSLALALFIAWCVYIWPSLAGKWLKWFTAVGIALLVAYMHLLAARTGLIVLYLFLFVLCVRLVFSKRPMIGIGILLALGTGFYFAARYVPTLEKRVWYAKESYRSWRSGEMSSGLSDVGRIISYRLATELISEHPLTGVGAGDMQQKMEQRYVAKYPNVPAEYRLIPHNQFMVVCLGCGIIAFIIFCVWCLYPLKWVKRNRGGFFMFINWLALMLALMVEPMLEIQLGVFVFIFFLLWQRHTLQNDSK